MKEDSSKNTPSTINTNACELCHIDSEESLSPTVGYPDIYSCKNCQRDFDGFRGKNIQNAKLDQILSLRDSRLPKDKEEGPKNFFSHLKEKFSK